MRKENKTTNRMKKSKFTSRTNYNQKTKQEEKGQKGITLIALVVTILFCYDELIKYSNNNSFLPITNLSFSNI